MSQPCAGKIAQRSDRIEKKKVENFLAPTAPRETKSRKEKEINEKKIKINKIKVQNLHRRLPNAYNLCEFQGLERTLKVLSKAPM